MKTSTCTLALWMLVTALALSTTATKAVAEPAILWTQQFGTVETDGATGVSADGLGNVYVTGRTRGSLGGINAGANDVYLGKYDASGSLLWMRQFGTDLRDSVSSASADGLGNVYLSGGTWGSFAGSDAGEGGAFLTKYDAAGTLLWIEEFGREVQAISANDVSADGLGNVYVTGFTKGTLGETNAGDFDSFLGKYDASGELVWMQQWGSPAIDAAWGVSADGLGSVYVGGYTYGNLGGTGEGFAYLTKYDAAGTHLWTQQFEKGVGGVLADNLGNVYVSGAEESGPNTFGSRDAILGKFDATGTLLWMQQWDGGGDEYAVDVSADGLGNVYLSGGTGPNWGEAGTSDAFITTFDASSGALLWTHQWGTTEDDGASGVSADGLGNVYVQGSTDGSLFGTSAGGSDIFLMKFSETSEPTGDFDENGQLDAADIDLLSTAVRDATYDPAFDLNLDTLVDQEDRRIWVEELAGTFFGDATLNQTVEFDDFLALSAAFGSSGGWANGDFDGSADVQFADFLMLADNYGQSGVGTAAVPEPSCYILLFVGAVGLISCRRRKARRA